MKLYSYFRSSAAYRVRIALNLKGVPYEVIPINLLRGEQRSAEFGRTNSAHLVPVLADGELRLTQSLAIIEYLEERYPAPPLLPSDPALRARVRALALAIACDIHPLNNLRVLKHLKALKLDESARGAWSGRWISLGFSAIEQDLTAAAPRGFCYGEKATLADCCLIPQVFNAKRVDLPMDAFPTILRIYENCMRLEAFQRATPEAQIDADQN